MSATTLGDRFEADGGGMLVDDMGKPVAELVLRRGPRRWRAPTLPYRRKECPEQVRRQAEVDFDLERLTGQSPRAGVTSGSKIWRPALLDTGCLEDQPDR